MDESEVNSVAGALGLESGLVPLILNQRPCPSINNDSRQRQVATQHRLLKEADGDLAF